MGTNYYAKRIPSEEEIKKMQAALDDRDWLELWRTSSDAEHEIHICKFSCGWQVNFDHNEGKYYRPSRASLEEFLSSPNIKIFDEYGESITPEAFWKQVDEHNANPRNDWVSKTYNRWEKLAHPEYTHYPPEAHQVEFCRNEFGVEPEDWDFEVDGLRFSVATDFC